MNNNIKTSENGKAKVARFNSSHKCPKCNGVLKQTRSGSRRVVCTECGTKYVLK